MCKNSDQCCHYLQKREDVSDVNDDDDDADDDIHDYVRMRILTIKIESRTNLSLVNKSVNGN